MYNKYVFNLGNGRSIIAKSIYSVSKAGMDGLTKSLAKELGPSNIRVNSIAPGTIDTDMNKNFSKEELEQIEEEYTIRENWKSKRYCKMCMIG